MTRELTDEQHDALAELAVDIDERLAAEDAAAAATQENSQAQPA